MPVRRSVQATARFTLSGLIFGGQFSQERQPVGAAGNVMLFLMFGNMTFSACRSQVIEIVLRSPGCQTFDMRTFQPATLAAFRTAMTVSLENDLAGQRPAPPIKPGVIC